MSPEDAFQNYWRKSRQEDNDCDFSDRSEVFVRDDLFEFFMAGRESVS